MSNSQLNKLNLGVKNGAEVMLNLSSNVISNFNDKTIFQHKLLLTNTQVPRHYEAFASQSSAKKIAKNSIA